MNRLSEYSSQTVIAAMQTVVVVGGTLATATMLKIAGYPESEKMWPQASVFARDSGFLFLLVPVLWVLASVTFERRYPDWFSKRWTVASGFIVLLALMLYFTKTAAVVASGW